MDLDKMTLGELKEICIKHLSNHKEIKHYNLLKTKCKNGHELSVKNKRNERVCKECNKISQRERRNRISRSR